MPVLHNYFAYSNSWGKYPIVAFFSIESPPVEGLFSPANILRKVLFPELTGPYTGKYAFILSVLAITFNSSLSLSYIFFSISLSFTIFLSLSIR